MRKLLFLVLAALALAVPVAQATPVDQILDNVQQAAFNYMWNEANPANGLIRDRMSGQYCSIASVGFGLSSICVGIDHGWITRTQGAARVQTTLNTFWTLPQGTATTGTIGYKGFFYHFLHLSDGLRDNSGTELSDIDTALLLAGILDCQQYFNGGDPVEVNIRSLADQIYRRVDWTWFRNNTQNGLMFSWLPNGGAGTFNSGVWKGYNEMMIMYILAFGSPTFPIPGTDWNTYTSNYVYGLQYGEIYVQYGALFTHQYSHCWIDFRNKRDLYMQGHGSDYFENSRKATLAQQAYCIANPGVKFVGDAGPEAAGYTATYWGLTAGDDPPPNATYAAHGAPGPGTFDNGTVQPTAVVSSVCFAPEICLPTIQNLYDNHPLLWGTYGFRDGLNKTLNPDWYDTDFLGIDQGPMVMMIENYRNASIWLRFMQNPYVQAGMTAAGFVNTVDVTEPPSFAQGVALSASPNPFSGRATVRYRLPAAGTVRLTVVDLAGREVARLVNERQEAGEHVAHFDAGDLPNGVYWYRLATPGSVVNSRGVRMR